MSTFDILAKFLEMYPQFHEQICQYAPGGFHRIVVWFKNGQVFDFSYFSDNNWDLVKHQKPKFTANSYYGRFIR